MSDKNYSTPILRGFTIKGHVSEDIANSEASLRRAQDLQEEDDGTSIELPYYPPTKPDPTKPDDPNNDNGGGSGGDDDGNEPDPGGGNEPDPGEGGNEPDPGAGGTSPNGKLTVKILDRKDNPDKYCDGKDWPIKLEVVSTVSPIIKIVTVMKIRPKNKKMEEHPLETYNITDGSLKKVIESNITYAQLKEWGSGIGSFNQLVVRAYNQEGDYATETDFVYIEECKDGGEDPGGEDPGGGENDGKLKVNISPKNTEPCYGEDIIVSGVAEGPYTLKQITMLINGSIVDNILITEDIKEKSYSFRYPPTSHEIGESFSIEVKAFDTQGSEASDNMTVKIKDCNEDPDKARDCLLFDTLHVEYYDTQAHDLMKIDIPSDWLPYQIDNNNGAIVTFGWGINGTVTAWYTGGGNATGYGFQLSSIGINYLDHYNEHKTSWAISIADKSGNVTRENLMLGDPAEKDNSRWINQIESYGNYTNSPGIGRIGDYVSFAFSNEWNTGACAIPDKTEIDPEQDPITPPDPTNPPVEDYDPTKNPVRDCLLLDKIVFQYYSDVSKDMQTNIVPLSWLVTQELTIQTKSGEVKLVAGWSDYYKGVSLLIRNSTGINNILLTGVGVIFKDYYDNSQTAWAIDINFKTAGAKHPEWMSGGPKTISGLPWVAEVDAGNYENAPMIGKKGDFIVSKHIDLFSNNVCSIDPIHNSDPETGVGLPSELIVNVPSLNPTVIEQCNNDDLTIGGYASMFPSVSRITAMYRGEQVFSTESTTSKKDYSFTIPSTKFSSPVEVGSARADIIFLIDRTGSMQGAIRNVATNIDKLVNRLTQDNINFRLGCIQYGDIYEGQPITQIGMTSNMENFRSMLQSINANGGGDINESGLESIMDPNTGALTYSFRPGSSIHFVLLTDAPVHDSAGDGKSLYSIDQTITQLKNRNIKTHVIGLTTSEVKGQLSRISTATGGQYVDINGDYGTQLTGISAEIADDAEELNSGQLLITATGSTGQILTRAIQINVRDCTVPSPSTPEEESIKNSYDLLFRLKWGVPTIDGDYDMDFHAFINKDPSKHLMFSSPKDRTYGYPMYTDGTSSMYLNFDYTKHPKGDSAAFDRDVEIITVDGFEGQLLTLFVHKYAGPAFTYMDRNAQVEIVDAATKAVLQTIVLTPSDFGINMGVIVCDIALKNAGQTRLTDITIRKESRGSITPV